MNVYLVKKDDPQCGEVVRITIIAPTVVSAERLMRDFNPINIIRDPAGCPIQMDPTEEWSWIRVGNAFESEDEPRIVDYYYHY